MKRALRRVALVGVILALMAAPVAFALIAWPKLEDARALVDDRWSELRPSLSDRYATLEVATQAAADAGTDAALVDELGTVLDEWSETTEQEDPAVEVTLANKLEGLGARLAAVTASSPRLTADEALTFALAVYSDRAPDDGAVDAYAAAALAYERDRSDVWSRPLTGVFGFESRASFSPAA